MLLEQIDSKNYVGIVPVGKAMILVEVDAAPKGELITAKFTQVFKKKAEVYLHRREFHISEIQNIVNDRDIIRFAKLELNDYKKRISSINRRSKNKVMKRKNVY
jgi:hypothetical protein